jgi:hypothetical protein
LLRFQAVVPTAVERRLSNAQFPGAAACEKKESTGDGTGLNLVMVFSLSVYVVPTSQRGALVLEKQ